jgi:hypothetical protein
MGKEPKDKNRKDGQPKDKDRVSNIGIRSNSPVPDEKRDEYDWHNGPWQHPDAKQAAFEIWVYIVFITVFCMQSTRSIFSADYFYFMQGVSGQFLGVEMLQEHSPVFGKVYEDITVVEEYYHWWLGGFAHTIFRSNTFDGSDWTWGGADRTKMLGYNQYIGGVRISQIRAIERDCTAELPPQITASNNRKYYCYGAWGLGQFVGDSIFDLGSEDQEDFGDMKSYDYTDLKNPQVLKSLGPFPYNGARLSKLNGPSEYKLDPLPEGSVLRERGMYMSSYTTSRWNTYPTGSHAIILDPAEHITNATEMIRDIIASGYIDLQTKAVIVEAVVYNPMLDRICYCQLIVEMLEGGGVFPSAEFEVVRMWSHHTPDDSTYDFLLGLCGLFYAWYGYQEYREYKEVGRSEYLSSPMNWMQLFNIMFFLIATMCKATVTALLPAALIMEGTDFNPFKSAVVFQLTAVAVDATNTFLNWFKLVALLSYAPQFAVMTDTLFFAAQNLTDFALVFFIVFTGFSQAYVLVFQARISEFRTLGQTMYSLMIGLLGDFDFYSLQQAHGYMGPFLFMIFIGLAVFVVLNMLIAIISEAYDTAVTKMRSKVPCHLTYELKLWVVEFLLFKVPKGQQLCAPLLPLLKHLLPMKPKRNAKVSGFKSRRRSVTGGSPHTPAPVRLRQLPGAPSSLPQQQAVPGRTAAVVPVSDDEFQSERRWDAGGASMGMSAGGGMGRGFKVTKKPRRQLPPITSETSDAEVLEKVQGLLQLHPSLFDSNGHLSQHFDQTDMEKEASEWAEVNRILGGDDQIVGSPPTMTKTPQSMQVTSTPQRGQMTAYGQPSTPEGASCDPLVETLLVQLQLSRYVATFAAEDITWNTLPELSSNDLKELGISLGHRKRMLRAFHGVGTMYAEIRATQRS